MLIHFYSVPAYMETKNDAIPTVQDLVLLDHTQKYSVSVFYFHDYIPYFLLLDKLQALFHLDKCLPMFDFPPLFNILYFTLYIHFMSIVFH